jgi:hypothetical protein
MMMMIIDIPVFVLFILLLTIFFDIRDGRSALQLAEDNRHGRSALQLAEDNRYSAIVNALRAAGAH